MQEFRSIYGHGFARVAACTTAARWPIPRRTRRKSWNWRAHAISVVWRWRCFQNSSSRAMRSATCSSSSRCWTRWRLRSGPWSRARPPCCPCCWSARLLRHAGALYNCAVAIHSGRLLGVVPKMHLPNYREFYEPRHFVVGDRSDGRRDHDRRHSGPFRHRPFVRGGRSSVASLSTPRFARMSGCPSRPVLPRRSPARRFSPIFPPAISPSARPRHAGFCALAVGAVSCGVSLRGRRRGQIDDRSCLGRSGLDLREWRDAGGNRALRGHPPFRPCRYRPRSPAQERLQMAASTPTGRAMARAFRRIGFRVDAARGDIGLERRSSAFRSCRPIRRGSNRTATRPTTSRSPRLTQRLRAIGMKHVVIGVSGGLDSTHALIVCAQSFDRLGLPRANILAYTMPGFATIRSHKGQCAPSDAGARCERQELDISPAAERMLADIGHPFARGEPDLRSDVRERAGGATHGLPLPPGQPSRRYRHRHGRPVRTGAWLVHLWRRRPDGALRRQCRCAEDADPAPDPLGDQLQAVCAEGVQQRSMRSWPPKSHPSWFPPKEGETPQSTEAFIGPYALQDFNLYYTLRHGFVPSKIAFLALHAWGDVAKGDWPPAFRRSAVACL